MVHLARHVVHPVIVDDDTIGRTRKHFVSSSELRGTSKL